MRSLSRLVSLSVLVLVAILFALPAIGAESDPPAGGAPAEGEGLPPEVIDFEYDPAVVIEAPPAEVEEQPWTTKFLVPTGLAIATVAVFVTVIQYFVRVVRSRYKVVE